MKINLKVAKKEKKEFILKGEFIRLDDLLKNVGVVQTGGHAKIEIQNENINGLKERMSKESFERLQDIMEEAKELEIRAPFEKIVNNSFVK